MLDHFVLVYDVESFKYVLYKYSLYSEKQLENIIQNEGVLNLVNKNILKECNYADYNEFYSNLKHLKKHTIANLDWILTGKCNLKCLYCFAFDLRMMDLHANWKTTCQHIKHLNVLHVTLSGGEPTLCKELINIINCLGENIAITIDSNGINTEMIKNLLPHISNNINFRITLDSTREEI